MSPGVIEVRRTVSAPIESVWNVAANVEAYPAFAPGFRAARILSRDADSVVVENVVSAAGLSRRFVSKARLVPPHSVTVRCAPPMLGPLEIGWRFAPLGPSRTECVLHVGLAGASRVLRALVDEALAHRAEALADAFARRAARVALLR